MAKNNYVPQIKLENCKIIFRNFSGKPTEYNRAGGKRTFGVVIDDEEFAISLKDEGWNVKPLKRRDDDESQKYYMSVVVRYHGDPSRDPKIYTYTSRKRTLMNEDTVGSIDYADIVNADVIISPSFWTRDDGSRGIAAYASTVHITLEDDPFGDKYSAYDDPSEEVPF